MKIRKHFILGALVLMGACASPSGEQSGMDRETKLKFDQYLVKGKELYESYCISCHQQSGEGLARLYPPLAGSDYLMADVPRAACIIKYGQFKEIVVNGTSYSQMMPGLQHLTNLEIAEILTYVTNTWGNEAGLQNVSEVEKWLSNCEED